MRRAGHARARVGGGRAGLAAPAGQMTWALHFSLAPTLFEPAETPGLITPFMILYALHDALVKPMPEQDHGAEPGRVVERVARRARLRVRAAQGRDVPQRRARHGRGRASSRSSATAASPRRCSRRGSPRSRRPDPGRVRFRLKQPWPDFMAFYGDAGDGRGVDRPQEVRREGGRGRLQEGAGRRRPVQVRLVHAGRRAGARGLRRLLAQDAEREAPGLQGGPGRRRRDWPCSSAARSTSPTRSTASSARRCGALPGSRCGRRRSWPPTGWSSPTSGTPSSPWHDRRVRLAANHAVDRQAINQAVTPRVLRRSPGASSPRASSSTGSRRSTPTIRPRPGSSSRRPGYPKGFDAGDFWCDASACVYGEPVLNDLQAVGHQGAGSARSSARRSSRRTRRRSSRTSSTA